MYIHVFVCFYQEKGLSLSWIGIDEEELRHKNDYTFFLTTALLNYVGLLLQLQLYYYIYGVSLLFYSKMNI